MLHGDAGGDRLRWLSATVPSFGVGSATEPPGEHQWIQVHPGGVRWARRGAASEEVPVAFERAEALGEHLAPAPMPERVELVERHRRAVARDQGMPTVFDLLGVNESGERAAGLDFLRVFVPQYAAIEEPRRLRREERSEPVDEVHEPFDPMLDRTETVDTLLAGRRLFLIGAPGAGKTALTRWLLLKLCVPGEGLPGFGEDQVPVRVEMRRFDEGERSALRGGRTYDFFVHLDEEHGERGWPLRGENLRALAREGRIYWLFDGLDEVIDEERRRRHAERIAALFEAYPKCHGVATSRSAGADVARPSLEGAGFATYALQGFVDPQRDRFLDAWHALVFARDPEVGRHRRARMAQAIEAAPSLRELCQSPLLCALLAYLNREEELPHRRHRLYQKILERMAEHWDANKGLPKLPGAERFEIDSKLLFLRKLAWHMLATPERNAGNAIEQSELEAFTVRFCEERWEVRPEAARSTAEGLIRHLRERNAVLAFFGGTTYGFAHRTFFEYLAAVEAHERFRDRVWELGDLEKEFAQHWEDPVWEEPLLLLCGLLAEGNPDHVVRVLQGIVAEDRAIVYGALDEHLAFCIKALGELPRLDRGLPFEFAHAINEILVFWIHNPPPPTSEHLYYAFRRYPGRWPEVNMLLAATRKEVAAERIGLSSLYECWMLAGGKSCRLSVLRDATLDAQTYLGALVEDASRFGQWSSEDTDEICALAKKRGGPDELSVLRALINSPGTALSNRVGPVQRLLDRIRHSGDAAAAYELARIGHHGANVFDSLRSLMESPHVHVAHGAIYYMTMLGLGAEVVGRLEQYAPVTPNFVAALAALARSNEDALNGLRRVMTLMRNSSDPRPFFTSVAVAANRGLLLATEEEILERLRTVTDFSVRHQLANITRSAHSLRPVALRAYDELYSLVEHVDGQAEAIASDVAHWQQPWRDQALLALSSRMLSSANPLVAIYMAGYILRTFEDPVARGRARERLLLHMSAETPEAMRFLAAQNLGARDAAGRETERLLARTAQNEQIRSSAASIIGDLDVLNTIADRAERPEVREQARRALDLYGHLDWLSKVGRPRHARVRFHGRDIGTLEETVTVGGPTRFLYSPAYLVTPGARPIAPNLKLRAEPYESDTLHPFFANLLPEGALYTRTARRLGLKRSDRFGMLLHVGADVMGAVEVLPAEPS